MRSLLAALHASSRSRLALALFAVPAILIGLVAMHVLTTGNMTATATHHSSAAAVTTTGTAMTVMTSPATDRPAGECGGACTPSMPVHEMLGTLCVLAVLAGMILLALQALLTGWPGRLGAFAILKLIARALAPPAAPSLHALSISRT